MVAFNKFPIIKEKKDKFQYRDYRDGKGFFKYVGSGENLNYTQTYNDFKKSIMYRNYKNRQFISLNNIDMAEQKNFIPYEDIGEQVANNGYFDYLIWSLTGSNVDENIALLDCTALNLDRLPETTWNQSKDFGYSFHPLKQFGLYPTLETIFYYYKFVQYYWTDDTKDIKWEYDSKGNLKIPNVQMIRALKVIWADQTITPFTKVNEEPEEVFDAIDRITDKDAREKFHQIFVEHQGEVIQNYYKVVAPIWRLDDKGKYVSQDANSPYSMTYDVGFSKELWDEKIVVTPDNAKDFGIITN